MVCDKHEILHLKIYEFRDWAFENNVKGGDGIVFSLFYLGIRD